jgi:hypothetical protein
MTRLRVHRSPLRQFLMGVAGLLLLIAAVEIVWAHQFTLEPETDDNGVLTSRGAKRRNQDLIVGTAFILTGGGLVAVALAGLVNPRAVVVVDDDGLRLRIAGLQRSVTIPWEEIDEVRSGREPGDGRRSRAVLLVALRHADAWPTGYWSARRDGRWLIVESESWATPAEEVVVHAHLALEAHRRDRRQAEEIDQA